MSEAITDNELVLAYRKLSGERKAGVYWMRKTTKELVDKLTGSLPDAMEHIGLAKCLYDGPQGVKTMSFIAVYGKPKSNLSDWQLDLKQRYETWREEMASSYFATYITEQVCQNERTLEDLRQQERITRHTAEKLLIHGLNEFCIVSGWGNQLEK